MDNLYELRVRQTEETNGSEELPLCEYLAVSISEKEMDELIAKIGECQCCERHLTNRTKIERNRVFPTQTPEIGCQCACRHYTRMLLRGKEKKREQGNCKSL